jgi:hypothetical protein
LPMTMMMMTIKWTLLNKNVCYYAVQKLPSPVIHRTVKIYKTTLTSYFMWLWNYAFYFETRTYITRVLMGGIKENSYLDLEMNLVRHLTLHIEKPGDLYVSSSIVSVVKPSRLRWSGHVA